MPIDQSKLDALKSLASGGTAGLNAYRQAQNAETASRTAALQNAIGGYGTPGAEPGSPTQGLNVQGASQAAQAQYAPSVGGNPFANAGNLQAAANSYLSQGANRLSNAAYQDQEELMLEAAKIGAAKNAQDRAAMLQGAADIYGESQKQALSGRPINDILAQRAQLDQEIAGITGATNPFAAGVGAQRIEALRQAQGQGQQLSEQDAAFLKNYDDKMAARQGLDEKAKQAFGVFAGQLGRDAKGLEEAYNSGDAQKVQDLMNYLTPEAQQRSRQIDMEGQKRLRELAPAFGINPLAAAGKFQEGEGNDLARVAQRGKQESYVGGEVSPAERKAYADQQANSYGFSSGTAYTKAKNTISASDEEMDQLLGSKDWEDLSGLANAFILGDTSVTGERKGLKGFQASLQDMVNSGHDVGPNGEQIPWSNDRKLKMSKLAASYYNSLISSHAGAGTAE